MMIESARFAWSVMEAKLSFEIARSLVIPRGPDSLQNLMLKRHALRVVFLKPV
jgi:hypothetical protein